MSEPASHGGYCPSNPPPQPPTWNSLVWYTQMGGISTCFVDLRRTQHTYRARMSWLLLLSKGAKDPQLGKVYALSYVHLCTLLQLTTTPPRSTPILIPLAFSAIADPLIELRSKSGGGLPKRKKTQGKKRIQQKEKRVASAVVMPINRPVPS